MAIDLGNDPGGTPPTAGEKLQIRSAIGVGQTDAPTFLSVTATDLSPAPTLANFKGSGGTAGIGFNSGNMWYGGSIYFISSQSKIRLASTHSLGWSTDIFNVDADLMLARDAPGVLAQRNGTAKQALRVYNTTDGTNSQFGGLTWLDNTNELQLSTGQTGTGAAQPLCLRGQGGINIRSGGAPGTLRWQFDTNGHFLAGTDNSVDIGASGANRPRNVYVGTSVIAATSVSAGGALLSPLAIYTASGGVISLGGEFSMKSPSGASTVCFFNNAQTDFNRLQLGGTTSAFPAIKRNSSQIDIRLADDSAFAAIRGRITTHSAYTATVVAATGYITIYDSTGTAYRVPCAV
jgi:hypothetical protein